MSVNGIRASDLSALINAKPSAKPSGNGFAELLALQTAGLQSDTLSSLTATGNGKQAANASATTLLNALNGSVGSLSPTGRNLSLFDPESAYQMMSFINRQNVMFKAQYSELSDMGQYVNQLQKSATGLQSLGSGTSNETLRSQLQQFVTQYNDWITHFNGDMGSGGALNGVQAADVSRYELEQSIKNIFNGAGDGFKGMESLGLTIDDSTHLAKLDPTQLDAALASNRQGVLNTVQQFAGNFAKSAELLTSDGNFISNRLNNLSGALQYIASNESSLQNEFGTGDNFQASGAIAKAAEAYDKAHRS